MKKLILYFLLFQSLQAYSQSIDSTKFRWDLTQIYTSMEEWEKDLDKFKQENYFRAFENGIKTEKELLNFCHETERFFTHYGKLLSYLTLSKHLNQSIDINPPQGKLYSILGSSFQQLEKIGTNLKKNNTMVLKAIKTRKEIEPYAPFLQRMIHADLLDEKTTRLLDLAENVFTYKADYDILQKLIDYPEVTLESGEKVKASNVDHRMYDNRNDREKLYKATYGSKDKYSDLYNSYFAAKVNHFYFLSQLYNDSTSITYLQRTRSDPDYAYTTLLNAIYANLSVHYRYLNLMRKILSIDTLQSWDLEHVPRGNNKTSYPLNLGLVIIQKAMSPYGKRYSDIIKKSYENRWIDAFKSSSKGYRVFAEDVPGVHPYVSVEYDNSYTAVRSLAHELGHCIHYKISADVLKPPFNEFYSLLQEVPSNVNESLINDYLIKTESKDRLSVLYETLFYLTGTLFSHAIEAETDYELHKKVDGAGKISNEDVRNTYLEIRRKYFGEELGISKIHPFDATYWTGYYHHVKYDFAFMGYVMGTVITAKIKKNLLEGKITPENYQVFLAAGKIQSLEKTLQLVGVDLTSPDTYQAIFDEMNYVMDEIEKEIK